jgi:hypothetical protein
MQGLANFTTAIADSIAVLLPAFCYLMACTCFFHFAWTLWTWADSHSRYQHPHRHRPWVPFVSLILCGVFATFPNFLTMANVSAGTGLAVSLTQYAPTAPPNVANVLGATPDASVIAVVALFQYFFQAFGAACVAWAIVRFRGIVNEHVRGSPTSCFVQFVFGICCINIVTIANGVEQFFQAGG